MKKPICYKALILSILFAFPFMIYGQKLPNVQEGNESVPANIRIDGDATEWGPQLKAYNKATEVYYTIADDQQNLYLIIRSDKKEITSKIIQGGITLKIENPDRKDHSSAVSVTYPMATGRKSKAGIADLNDEPGKLLPADLLRVNNALETDAKTILIKGTGAIPDSLISVYNEYGIKAAQQISADKLYSYELAIPLKYLNGLPGNGRLIRYNIRLNGSDPKAVIHVTLEGIQSNARESSILNAKINQENLQMLSGSPTDVTSIYPLSK